jgi:hypothetical protein
MGDDFRRMKKTRIRATDSNTLLRMYDAAKELSARSSSLLEKDQARRALHHIGRELRTRHVMP